MGSLYKTFVVVLVFSFVVPAAAVIFLSSIELKPTLLPGEKEVLAFSFLLPPRSERKNISLSDLKNPFGGQGRDYPPVALAELAPVEGSPAESPVSLIVLDKTRRLAVVKGTVLKEGDTFQGARVTRIEKDRVLLTNGKEEKWLIAK